MSEERTEEKEIAEVLPEIDMNLEIIMHDVDAIIPYENNPRDNDNSVDNVVESIKNFGFLVPIVIDKDNVLVAGHTRIKALKKMGIKQVPCILADKLTEDQIKAYRLADNMTSMNSKWNGKLVRLEMKNLPEFDFTKFGMPEKFMDFKDRIKVEEDDFDEGQFIVDEPHSKQGDLYLLGNHRLLVGDSTNPESVKRLIENEEVDLVVTDPPYNVNYEGSDGQTIKNDFMDKEAYKAFLDKVFTNLKASLKEGGAFYIWFATMELRNIVNSLFDVGLDFRSMLIWKKPSPNLSYADYKWIYETPATYDSDGYITYTCSRCGDSYKEITESKLEHHYSEEWTTDSKYHYHVCTDEGFEDLIIDKEEHDFESTFTAPTYDVNNNAWVDGTFSRECKICHYVHSWSLTKEQYDTNIALGRFPEISGNTVHYGLYPDNIITDANEIAALDEAKIAAHKYGNEAIFKYNGGYYRRCAAQNTSNGYTGTTSGSYYYFKMNRVRWEIVERYDDGSALLLSKWILDGGTYDDDASTYANSQLHERLSKWKSRSPLDLLFGNDGDMMESARYLMKHTVVNSGDILGADPYYGERYYSDNTEDYLHIPSLGEIIKWGKEVDKNLWLTEATSYAQAMNSDINSRSVNDFYWYSSYWTRTPQSDAYVKAAYGRMTDPDYGPFYTSFGKSVTDSIGLRYCIRVQLDITKPVNFSHISTLAMN